MSEKPVAIENCNYEVHNIQEIINFLEDNLLDELRLSHVADHFYLSSSLINRIFKIVTDMTIMEYVRNRRLSLAGQELLTSKITILDLALKYGYETPEAFTKAFTRCYGVPPSIVRRTYPRLKQFQPLQVEVKVLGGWVGDFVDNHETNLTKHIVLKPDKELSADYNQSYQSKGEQSMEQERCNYEISLKEMNQKEDWRILMLIARKLKAAGIVFKVDGKTMIFAHGLEFKLDKICFTFKWNEEQKVRAFFGEEGISAETFPGFKYFDTMFEGKKIRCMCYGDFPGSDTDAVLYENTDLVEVDGEQIRVQSLEFYYENAKPDEVYYKMVEEWLNNRAV